MEADPNSWYRLRKDGKFAHSLAGSHPYINGHHGLVALARSDNITSTQQWQFFPHSSSTYLLRTKASGTNGYLAASSKNGSCENAIPIIHNSAKVEESMLWSIQVNEDDTYRLSNHVRGRICYLSINEKSLRMSPDNATSLDQFSSLVRLEKINDIVFSTAATAATAPTSRVSNYVHPATGFATSAFVRGINPKSTAYSHSSSYTVPSPTSIIPSPSSSTPLRLASRLSPSAAMGVGVAVGIASIIILISIALLIYRGCKLRHSPANRHYQQAKQWKGFIPATPSTARTTFTGTKMANIYFAELPTPATPAFMLSPPLERDVGNRASWQSFGSVLPNVPGSPPIELPP